MNGVCQVCAWCVGGDSERDSRSVFLYCGVQQAVVYRVRLGIPHVCIESEIACVIVCYSL